MSFTEEEQEAVSRYIDGLNKTLEYQTLLLEVILQAHRPKDKYRKARNKARSVVWPEIYGAPEVDNDKTVRLKQKPPEDENG